MKRSLGGLMAAALLLAGVTATTASAPATTGQTAQRTDSTKASQPKAPAKPVATTRKVQLQARPLSIFDSAPRIRWQPGPRRVKYGRSRWVLLS